MFSIQLITAKRDYIIATENVEDFVKWVIALRKTFVKARIC